MAERTMAITLGILCQPHTTNGPYLLTVISTPIGDYELIFVYPNPMREKLVFEIRLNHSSDVAIKIFNSLGKLVDVIGQTSYSAGTNNIRWENRYFKILSQAYTITK